MVLSEFDLIARYFSSGPVRRADVVLGVGDDCALLQVPAGRDLAVSLDSLVAGVHFRQDTDPTALGHKALAVGLSDLAAMGAEPAWATLALTLTVPDPDWLEGFSRGFLRLAAQHGVQLVGGDTTRGPLSVSVQVHGFLPKGQALRRQGARPGDRVYVTGTLGDAGLALRVEQGLFVEPAFLSALRSRLDRPLPRVAEGVGLLGVASAAIDVSDGLAADLGHILRASGCGATLYLDRLPCSAAVRAHLSDTDDWSLPLSAGDDYELCFTVPETRQGELEELARGFSVPVTRIGLVEARPGLRCLTGDGRQLESVPAGYEHFSPE